MKLHPVTAVLALWLSAVALAAGAIRYVDINSTNPAPPYLTWNTPATNIQDAVDVAVATAFVAEIVIACGMMLMVLFMTNTPKLARYTALFGGTLVFLYITFEAPLSGMSINPARTVASALPSGIWTAAWIYLVAPVGGMLLAVEIYRGLRKGARVACAKWNHDMRHRCIFCGHPGVQQPEHPVKPLPVHCHVLPD